MKTIKDSVHDHITIDGLALDLLDTSPVQRLRHIKQLGTVSLVYPSANHTRFEHSIGVYHLACEVTNHLEIPSEIANHIRAAAMLHDIGHSPYSHNIEPLLNHRIGFEHENIEELLTSTPLCSVLETHNIDPNMIANLIIGKGQYGQIISSSIDVDRMDYLVRDAHHTGVPYGAIDHGRLVRELTFIDDELVLSASGGNVQAAESLLLARTLMGPTVYNHHVARISKSILRRATEFLLDSEIIKENDLRNMDDHDLHAALRSNSTTAPLEKRISNRNLYKRAIWAEMKDVPDDVINADYDSIRTFENHIASKLNVDRQSVIIDIPSPPSTTAKEIKIKVGDEIRMLHDHSPLIDALQDAQKEQWRLGVYAPKNLVDRVGSAAENELNLETNGHLISMRSKKNFSLDKFIN
ncbi:MAG: HD domain-containing protein [Halobacteriales archaeon]|nr:HD domain-containing protein [Halobacteriales archaeon]